MSYTYDDLARDETRSLESQTDENEDPSEDINNALDEMFDNPVEQLEDIIEDLKEKPMNKYTEYANLKAEIRKREERLKEIDREIVEDLQDQEGNKLQTDHATFSLYSRPKYTYSEKLVEQENLVKEKIKIMKKEEEIKGIAKMESNGWTLRCQLTK